MTPIIINGSKVWCPSCYEELTTGTFQRIKKEWDVSEPDLGKRDFFKLFSILTGTAYNISRTPENEATIWNAIHWYVTQPFQFSKDVPSVLEINGRTISIPKKVGALSIGQNIHLREALSKATYFEECISISVAIALQPLYDGGKYDIDKSLELEKVVLSIPVYLTYPIGFFLLPAARTLGMSSAAGSRLAVNSRGLSLGRMLPKWLKSGGSISLTTSH